MLDLNHALSESRKLHFFFCLSSFLSLQFTHLISPIRSISQWSCLENNVLLLIESQLAGFFFCLLHFFIVRVSFSISAALHAMHCRHMDLSFNYVKQGRISPSPKTANYLSIPYYLLIWHKYMHAEQRKTSEDTGTLPSNAISD